MGFGEVVLLGLVLLLSGGNLCAATRNQLNSSATADETLSSQVPQGQPTGHRSNRTGHTDPVPSPSRYRLRIHQLRKSKQPLAGEPTSEQLEPVRAQELLMLVQGPDLNPPVKQDKVLVKFEQRVPAAASSVAARCGEGKVTVEVKQNFLGNGQLIRSSDLTLGGCAALKTADHVLLFQTELQGCGSTLTMTEEALVYSFTLMYSPTPIGDTFILKTNRAHVAIECHYRRRHHVSSAAVRPTWTPFASDTLAEQPLHFSLRLMTEDWQSQRPSSVYFLSDVMHIEAAVLQGHHVPLRVFVDSCVATANPDPASQPRYPFVSNHGCLTDAKLTGAKSYFMQRSREDRLQFQLKAARFHLDRGNSLFITCHLRATTASAAVDPQHKACSFLTEAKRWVASGGDNKVCSCCESSCSERRRKRSLAEDTAGLPPALQWEGTAALGPILLEEDILREELTELLLERASLLQTRGATQEPSSSTTALLCGAGAALAVALLAFMGAAICSRLGEPAGHAVCT